jgi:SAM-dependent methyltransferase
VGLGLAGLARVVSALDATSEAQRPGDAAACRLCSAPLRATFADLGVSPLANSYLAEAELGAPETFFPLHVFVCEQCFLVQLPVHESAESIFRDDYAYFSSYSESWVDHARRFAEAAIERFGLDESSRVIEVASNDGYLLQFFAARGIDVLGVEPARNVAEAAVERGIPTLTEFFDEQLAARLAAEGRKGDLLVGNNVLAHVPAVHGFVEGLSLALAPGGVVSMEFPHLLELIEKTEFDTIYHEHFSYFSLLAVERLFAEHGMTIFDVEELPTHGGSLRISARHAEDGSRPVEPRVGELRDRERAAGLDRLETYTGFGDAVQTVKRNLLDFLIQALGRGERIAGYGAAAKGNTLLNYCGVGPDFLDYVVDRSPHKQGRYLPGSRIAIHGPERVAETKPDWLLILPWNLEDEIVEQMAHVREWGGRFVVPIPDVRVID